MRIDIAQDNFAISQQTYFNNNQLLRKNIFSINKNRAIRKPKSSDIKPSINYKLGPVLITIIIT